MCVDEYEGKFLFHIRVVRFDPTAHYQLHGALLGLPSGVSGWTTHNFMGGLLH
jgi:hypothetical protein